MKKEITYSEAMAELDDILNVIQSQKIDIDALSERVARASFLIKLCKTKLRTTEEEIQGVFDEN